MQMLMGNIHIRFHQPPSRLIFFGLGDEDLNKLVTKLPLSSLLQASQIGTLCPIP